MGGVWSFSAATVWYHDDISSLQSVSMLSKLNSEQKEAATYLDGPLLVLAGVATSRKLTQMPKLD